MRNYEGFLKKSKSRSADTRRELSVRVAFLGPRAARHPGAAARARVGVRTWRPRHAARGGGRQDAARLEASATWTRARSSPTRWCRAAPNGWALRTRPGVLSSTASADDRAGGGAGAAVEGFGSRPRCGPVLRRLRARAAAPAHRRRVCRVCGHTFHLTSSREACRSL